MIDKFFIRHIANKMLLAWEGDPIQWTWRFLSPANKCVIKFRGLEEALHFFIDRVPFPNKQYAEYQICELFPTGNFQSRNLAEVRDEFLDKYLSRYFRAKAEEDLGKHVEKKKEKTTLCPICEEGTATERIKKNPMKYKGMEMELFLHFYLCDNCESEFADATQVQQNKQYFVAFKELVNRKEGK